MEPKTFCQSCSMPIDDVNMRGTEIDGSTSHEYCKYCYVDGKFVSPGMTLDQMRALVKTKMAEMHIPSGIIDKSVQVLPELKRWREKSATIK